VDRRRFGSLQGARVRRDRCVSVLVCSPDSRSKLILSFAGFWTPLRLGKLSAPIANQLLAPHQLSSALVTSHYHPLLSSYSQSLVAHEDLLKVFNTSLLMLTRSDDLKVKRGALEALDQVWDSLGDGMLGLVPETTPFLAETMEEGEGGVEVATRKLVKRIEEHLGESLSSYLES
jgi:U3 small nucleolar RNA-associated protein 10